MTDNPLPVIWSKGKLTYLRPVIENDLFPFNRWINDPEMEELLSRTAPVSFLGQKAWYERITSDDPNKLTLSICLSEDHTLIGNIFLGIDPEKQKGGTGTIIGEDKYRGKGYGTDAKMQILRYAFMTRALRKVQSNIFATNIRSQRYGEKCGYKHVATIPKEFFRNGVWIDQVIFEVYRDDWLKLWNVYNQS